MNDRMSIIQGMHFTKLKADFLLTIYIFVSLGTIVLPCVFAIDQVDRKIGDNNGLNGDVEMAPYTVVADRGEYEERRYPARKWVCSSRASIDREASTSSLFRLLFNYISGKNKPNIRIDMTSPVTTYVEPTESPNESKFTMGFLIPEEHQLNPPASDDPQIFIEERPEIWVLTRRFGGYANDTVVAKEAKDLAEILEKAGEKSVDYTRYYIAGYDPPFKPINRRNEIWYVKQTQTMTQKVLLETAVAESTPEVKDQQI